MNFKGIIKLLIVLMNLQINFLTNQLTICSVKYYKILKDARHKLLKTQTDVFSSESKDTVQVSEVI